MLEELTPRKAIEFAMKTEELGQVFYKRLSRKFEGNEELVELFTLLAKDEAVHERQFRTLMEKTPPDDFVSNQDERLQYLRVMSMSQFFMGEKGLHKTLDEIKEKSDALMWALELEKATLQYYNAMKEVMGDDETISAVIKAEREHLAKIMRYLVTDAKFRGITDNF